MTPEERATLIYHALETRQRNIWPADEKLWPLIEPGVNAMRADYAVWREKTNFSKADLIAVTNYIASAIRAAENDAIERAARLLEKRVVRNHIAGVTNDATTHVEAIRSLKHKDI